MTGEKISHVYNMYSLKLFDMMKHLRTNNDNITCICVLLACSHVGVVDYGYKYFNKISASSYIIPMMNHYACINLQDI